MFSNVPHDFQVELIKYTSDGLKKKNNDCKLMGSEIAYKIHKKSLKHSLTKN